METFGAQVYPSPSDRTNYGRTLLAQDPSNLGSLGIAISEAVEAAATSGGAKKYGIGSVFDFVLLHQTVIGEEALKQMDMAGEYPDVVIGCVGGGSNFSGIAFPFLRENLREGRKTRLLAVEPTAAPSLTRGQYTFDYGDTAQMAPIVKMHTLGHTFVPPEIHAGGLRYHGMAPMVCALYDGGLIEARAVGQLATFDAAVQFAHAEGILPAPESAHAIRAAIDEALDAKMKGEKRVILFNLSGHGHSTWQPTSSTRRQPQGLRVPRGGRGRGHDPPAGGDHSRLMPDSTTRHAAAGQQQRTPVRGQPVEPAPLLPGLRTPGAAAPQPLRQ
jgi:tryptophan synthase beta chain